MAKIIVEIEDVPAVNGSMVSFNWTGDFKIPESEAEMSHLTNAQKASLNLNSLVSWFEQYGEPPQRLS